MYYCSYCDGKNEKAAEYCVHCGVELLAKDDYERKVENITEDIENSKSEAVSTVFALTILGALLAIVYINEVFSGAHFLYGIDFLLAFSIVLISNGILTRRAKSKERAKLAQIGYLYKSGASSATCTAKEAKEVAPDDTKASGTETSSKLKGEIRKSVSISMASKQKEAYDIYMYSPYHMTGIWVCEYCDTENAVTKEKCIVCGMLK